MLIASAARRYVVAPASPLSITLTTIPSFIIATPFCRCGLAHQIHDRAVAAAQPFEPLDGRGILQVARHDRSRLEHLAVLQFLDDRDVFDRHLADQQRIQVAALLHVPQNRLQPAQIDRVLGQAAAAIDSHRDVVGRALVESVIAVERAEGLDERRTVGQMPHGHDTGRELPHPAAAQSTDQVFGQHRQPFLQLFITGQPRVELLKRLQTAVVIRQQMRADFVGQAARRTRDGGRLRSELISNLPRDTISPLTSPATCAFALNSGHACR